MLYLDRCTWKLVKVGPLGISSLHDFQGNIHLGHVWLDSKTRRGAYHVYHSPYPEKNKNVENNMILAWKLWGQQLSSPALAMINQHTAPIKEGNMKGTAHDSSGRHVILHSCIIFEASTMEALTMLRLHLASSCEGRHTEGQLANTH